MAGESLRCEACHKPYEGQVGWHISMTKSHAIRVLCPDCQRDAQTGVESAE